MKNLFKILFLFSVFIPIVSCIEDEEFVWSERACLSFSEDTINFNTVISGSPSFTQTLWIYNEDDKNIIIPRVRLLMNDSSVFRINIDGMSVSQAEAHDVEIRSKDSLCIFVDAFAPTTENAEPVEIKDQLIFVLNDGVEQRVQLLVKSQSVNPITRWFVDADTVLSANRPYHVKDTLCVMPDVTLTLDPGVVMLFQSNAVFEIRGHLIANGTCLNQVVFRGDRFDDMFKNQPYDRVSGQWQGLHFTTSSYGNELHHVDLHSARTAVLCDSSNTEKEKILIENSIIHNNSQDGLCFINVNTRVGNSQISNCGGNCVTIIGGRHEFTHATLAQFYPFALHGTALYFTNVNNELRCPLHALNFTNSIITGSSGDEIMGVSSDRYTDTPFNYSFSYCLLNTPYVEHEAFVNCLWDDGKDESPAKQDNFYPPFSNDSLIYTFGLSPKSKAVDAAYAPFTQSTYPLDRLGVVRELDKPDLGCYELIKEETED